MGQKKQQQIKNQRIQKEQTQLLQIQNELENILGKVNEAINELKVEELQLKSSAVTVRKPQLVSRTEEPKETQCVDPPSSTSQHQHVHVPTLAQRMTADVRTTEKEAQLVNQQKIELDNLPFQGRAATMMMEEEEDDDED